MEFPLSFGVAPLRFAISVEIITLINIRLSFKEKKEKEIGTCVTQV
jgi:hypothetical protein